jgi:hypothetical protein
MRNYLKINLLTFCIIISNTYLGVAQKQDFELTENTTVHIAENEPTSVKKAAEDLISDIEKTTDLTCRISDLSASSQIIVQTKPDGFDYERYGVKSENGNLILSGNNEQATIFAIYYFIQHFLGIDPVYF